LNSRFAALSLLVAVAFSCSAPAAKEPVATSPTTNDATPRGPVDVRAALEELNRRSVTLKACTATYRATGPLDQTVRFIYLAPDRARFDASGTQNAIKCEMTVWSLGDRYVLRSNQRGARVFADVPADLPSMEADSEALTAALASSFPSPNPTPKSGDALPDLGPGVTLNLWVNHVSDSKGDSSLDGSVSWSRDRSWILQWLMRVSALPVLRDEGERIVAEDPRTKTVVSISKATGFIESIRGTNELSVELTSWTPSVDETELSIPPPEPDARDVSEDYAHSLSAVQVHEFEHLIIDAAVAARQRDSIQDEDFTTRLASVYLVANRTLRRDAIAKLRDLMKKLSDDVLDKYRRQRSAEAIDPDFRGIADQWIAKQRLTIVDTFEKVADVALEPDPTPPAHSDPHVAELISEARRRSMAKTIEVDLKQPALAYFDEQVLAVQSTK
jgi:hypothetical protein